MWLCIHLTQLSLDVLRRAGVRQRCIAVVESHGSQRHIHECDPAAASAGVRAGLKLSAAYALTPELTVFPRDRAAEQHALHHVAVAAYRFSSRVSIRPPDCVTAEIARSRRLLAKQRLQDFLSPLEYRIRLSGAPTPEAARLLAHAGRYHLSETIDSTGDIALHHTGLEAETVKGLHGVGVETIDQLLALPRDGLGRRFGHSTLDYLDRLTGRCADPLPWFEPPTQFESTLELPQETEDATALVFAASRLLSELQIFLETRELAAQRLLFCLAHAHGRQTAFRLGLREPGRDAGRLADLFRERMTHAVLPAPVRRLTLEVTELCRGHPHTRDLFEAGCDKDEHDWARLLERLRSRLGDAVVRRLELIADYRPERAWRECAVDAGATAGLELRDLPPRPMWLLREPQALDSREIRLITGPERIESGWWDDRDIARDYYIAENDHGQRLWVYQDCRRRERWFVHGLFA